MSTKNDIRVLIAEDDYLVSEMIKGILEGAGYTIVGEATNGLEAITMTRSLRPDVVLMDIEMPDMDGISATRLIYEKCPTPVVVLTAYETKELVEGASAAGVGAYLVKPPKVSEIERAITVAMVRFDDMVKLHDYAERLEQKVQERTAQLETQYARSEAILRSTSDGLVVTNRRGAILLPNPVAQAWLDQTLSPHDSDLLRQEIANLAQRANERPKTTIELTGLDLELAASPILEPTQAIAPPEEQATAVVSIYDVSHLKALDRMKSRFVENISHEMRTPIATLKLSLAMMKKTPPQKWNEYLDTLGQEVDWLARLVQDVLQISRIDTGRLEITPGPAPLNQLVEKAIANHISEAQEQGLKMKRQLAKPGPVVLADRTWLTQALDRLIKNAILYTPRGGQVTISTGTESAGERTWATATISDTGIGIPAQEMSHIFEQFFRGERPRTMQISGTGLGLTIVKEIVELHGGRVTVESEIDSGSSFTIWLPLADAGQRPD